MNKITKENITANMLVKLEAFNKNNVELSGTTRHSDVLSTVKHQTLYRGAIYKTIKDNGGTKVKFPTDWLNMTVDEVADDIISKQVY